MPRPWVADALGLKRPRQSPTNSAPDHRTGSKSLRSKVETALLVVAVALQWDLGAWIGGDGWYRYQDLVALVTRGDPHPQSPEGTGYSLILPILASPLYAVGNLFGQPDLFVARFNALAFTAMIPVAYVALRGPLGSSTAKRFLLLLLTATLFPNHLTQFYAEVAAALLCGIGFWGVAHEHSWGWFLAIVGAVSTPALLVPLSLVCALRWFERRRLDALWPAVLAVGLYLLESRIRRGAWISTHYLTSPAPGSKLVGFSNPLASGVFDVVLSFGKGLVFYLPALFLPIPPGSLSPELGRWRRFLLAFTAGMVVVYAKWWGWSGDWFWGPRFFLFASLPAALTLAVRLAHPERGWRRWLTLVVTGLSLWVGLDGALFGNLEMGICVANGRRDAALCHHTLEYSALWRPFLVAPHLGAREWSRIVLWLATGCWLMASEQAPRDEPGASPTRPASSSQADAASSLKGAE